jgi:hypothetical protein
VSFASISKLEGRERQDFGDSPSECLICRLAVALEADEKGLLTAGRIPEANCSRFFERPDTFRQILRLDDRRLDRVPALINGD